MILPNSPLMEIRQCHVCGSGDPVILHNLPYRGAFSFLCTACVLRHHPGKFCPLCFDAYDDDDAAAAVNSHPSAHSHLMCYRCPAVVHAACLPSSARPSSSSTTLRYLCPQCSHPSSLLFDFRSDDGSSSLVFSRDLTKQVLCAAKVVSVIMHQAAVVARAEADQKAREALVARKRAKQAIERVAYLMAKEAEDDSDLDDG